MPTAREIIEDTKLGRGILVSCHPDEPVFVLRASDLLAADTVDHWASHARLQGVQPDKVRTAHEIAEAMREWPNKKVPD